MSGWREIAEQKTDSMRYGPLELMIVQQEAPCAEGDLRVDMHQPGVHIVAIGAVSTDCGYVTIALLIQECLHPSDDTSGEDGGDS